MRILLVGATGRLGAAVGEALTGRGHEVVTVGRTAGDVQADVADPEQTARDIVTEVAITTDGDGASSSGPTRSSSWRRSTPATSPRSPGPSPGSAPPAAQCSRRPARSSPPGTTRTRPAPTCWRSPSSSSGGRDRRPRRHAAADRAAQADRPPDPGTPLVRWPRPIAFPADRPAPPRGAAAPPRGGRGAGEGRTDDTHCGSPGRH
jgi:hypothetical protein